MFQSGRRLFSAASIGLLVVAAMHSLSHFAPPPADPGFVSVQSAMKSYTIPLGFGMQPSLHDIHLSLSVFMSVILAGLGLQNLVAAASDTTARFLRRMTWLNVFIVGSLLVIFGYFRIPPPLITLAVVELLFVTAAVFPDRQPAPVGTGSEN